MSTSLVCLIAAFLISEVRGLASARFKGCIRGSGVLRGYTGQFPDLTVQACTNLCFSKGFTHAALHNGFVCSCGDFKNEIETIPESECNIKCGGNRSLRCGGRDASNLYHTGIKNITAEGKEIECLSDGGDTRLLPESKMELLQTNSPDRCVSICNSLLYRHAGLQNSVDCYCGNMEQGAVQETGCDLQCPGDKQKTCGGNYKMMVYNTGILGGLLNTKIKYIGCYKNRPKGLLRAFKQDYTDLDPAKCLAKCVFLKAEYAGLFNGTQCQCGRAPVPVPEAVPEVTCSTPCSGSSSKMCGGESHVAGYFLGNLGDPLHGRRIGCFKDEDGLLLSGTVLKLGQRNSPLYCVHKCIELGFRFAAVSNTFECRCDSVPLKRTSSIEVEGFQCNSSCPLSKTEFCGGQGLSYVYRTGLDDTFEASCKASASEVDGRKACTDEVVIEEKFNNLNLAKWAKAVQISSNDYEFVIFNSEESNIYTENGVLTIRPTLLNESFVNNGHLVLKGCTAQLYTTQCQQSAQWFSILPPVQSARICSVQSFKYGIITVRAKLPEGDWLIPRIELRPEREVYGRGYLSGVIRLALSRGNNVLISGTKEVGSTRLDFGLLVSAGDQDIRNKTVSFFSPEPWSSSFHNYSLLWSPDGIWAYVDGRVNNMQKIYEAADGKLPETMGFSKAESKSWASGANIAPFDIPMEICFGVGVGGSRDFPDNSFSSGIKKPWRNFEVKALLNFWLGRNDWLPTWSKDPSLQIDHISVTAI